MKKLIFLFLILPVVGIAQNSLSVEVHGVKNSDGKINVAVYNNSDDFLKFDQVYKSDSAKANEGITHLQIDNLPKGEYALAIFHDENGNDELDTNWLGIPKEDIGFSNAKMKTFGPPSFKDCLFPLQKSYHITVTLQ